jgi:Flp pilus assembly protein TadD
MDTLAMLLAEKKDYGRAIELERRALELQPRNGTLRLHLAKIYLQSGDKSRARNELETLAKLGDKFHAHAEVAALIKSM